MVPELMMVALAPRKAIPDAELPLVVIVPEWVMAVSVHRQRLWDQIGDLNNGGFLAHRNPKESEDEPEILCPTRPCAS